MYIDCDSMEYEFGLEWWPCLCLQSFGRAVELDPNRLFALVQAGKLNAQTGDNDASLHCFNQALSIDANYPPALLGMAEALLTLCRSYLRMGVTKIAANLANEAWKLAERCTKFHGNLKVGNGLWGFSDEI